MFIGICQCFDLDSIFLQKNVCLLRTFFFCWKWQSDTDISLINPCGEIPTTAFWTIHSFKEPWVFVYLHLRCGYVQTPLPSRKFHLQFCPLSVLTTGCRGWWSLSCQSWLLAGKTWAPLTELSDCCPQTKWAHMLNLPPQTKLEGSASSRYSNLYLECHVHTATHNQKPQERKTPHG